MFNPARFPLLRCAALALMLAALPAAAQTPSDESLNRLIELQNLPAQLRSTLPSAADVANQEIARRLEGNAKLSSQQRAALGRAANRYLNSLYREVFLSEDMLSEMSAISRNAMRRTYTQEEVDAMLAFYRTPVGQSIMRKQSDLAKEIMPDMVRLLSSHIEPANRRLMPEFQREVESIMQSAPHSGGNGGKSGTGKRR